jgi:hypothetical protein
MGIQLESFAKYEKSKPYNPWITRRPSSMEHANRILSEGRANGGGMSGMKVKIAQEKLMEHFPINHNELDTVKAKFELELNKTTTIHIRRGDYERVASCLVEFSEYEDLLRNLSPFIDSNLLFISDSSLPSEAKEKFKTSFPNSNIKFYTSHEISTTSAHDIMRMSRVLITANSTFSFSAGLLSDENTIVLSPIEFFGGEDGYLQSRVFNRYGNFFVMQKNSKE